MAADRGAKTHRTDIGMRTTLLLTGGDLFAAKYENDVSLVPLQARSS